jgi:hypothetical protein
VWAASGFVAELTAAPLQGQELLGEETNTVTPCPIARTTGKLLRFLKKPLSSASVQRRPAWVRVQVGGNTFLHNLQTRYGAQCVPGLKCSGCETGHSPQSSEEFKNGATVPPLPHTSS